MRTRHIVLSATAVLLILGTVIAWPRVRFYTRTGHFRPIYKIESLRSPLTVVRWSPEGLHLADGRTVPLRSLPGDFPALAEATKRGIEVQADGRVVGLVRVHRWCGNDPVEEHLARVDISDLLTFLGVGDTPSPDPARVLMASEPDGAFSKQGWRIEEFMQFQSWQFIQDSKR